MTARSGSGRAGRRHGQARTGRALTALALSAAVAVAALAGCTTQVRHHGYAPDEMALSELQIGRDDRETVAAAIGRPGTLGVLTDSGWYYVGSRWEQFAHRPPVEVDREVVALSFDQRGTLANVERFGLQDGEVVTLSRRVTDTQVAGVGLVSQLLRNLGRVTAGQFFD